MRYALSWLSLCGLHYRGVRHVVCSKLVCGVMWYSLFGVHFRGVGFVCSTVVWDM